MGLDYFGGKSWWEVTRDERFFCMRLHRQIEEKGVQRFISFLNRACDWQLTETSNWEAGYEVCFYRDLWHLRQKEGKPLSLKRTFDLCLFSNDCIVIIEAKCYERMNEDQVLSFGKDRPAVQQLTGVEDVRLLGLISGKYDCLMQDSFDSFITWQQVADEYDQDLILQRANDIFDPDFVSSYGRNNLGGYMSGLVLLEEARLGKSFFVGRDRGLNGTTLAADFSSGAWRTRMYETNMNEAPNKNWFTLSEFVERIPPEAR